MDRLNRCVKTESPGGTVRGEQEQPRDTKQHLHDIMVESDSAPESAPEEELNVHEN
jgi:hypothetical protein